MKSDGTKDGAKYDFHCPDDKDGVLEGNKW